MGFKLWVTEEKLVRVEMLLEELWKKRGETIGVRELAKVAGVIGSFMLAMENVARFYTRGMLTQVAEMAGGRECWTGLCFGEKCQEFEWMEDAR